MLLVKTIVKPSDIHGLGLFADEFISKGTITWVLDPLIDLTYTQEQINLFPNVFKNYLATYSYEIEGGNRILCGDGAKHINHSDNPNINSIFPDRDVAIKDINIGDEIVINYYEFDKETIRLKSVKDTDLI